MPLLKWKIILPKCKGNTPAINTGAYIEYTGALVRSAIAAPEFQIRNWRALQIKKSIGSDPGHIAAG